MSILGNIIGAIFGSSPANAQTAAPTVTGQQQPPQHSAATPSAVQKVDVAKVLNEKASQNNEKLDWQTSIVDLLKLLNLDSSLTARKQLAQELNFSGDTDDSAAMNIWLHQQVMNKLAENGGVLPADLQSGRKVA